MARGKKGRSKPTIMPPVIIENLEKNAKTVEARLAARRTAVMTGQARAQRRTVVEPQDGEDRHLHDAGNTEDLPGKLVRREDDPETDDEAISHLYDDTGDVYSFFRRVMAWKSYDGKGARMLVAAHVGLGMDNAYWNGTLHASGDGHYFRPFHYSPTIAYHEWFHAFTEHTINLIYDGQPGALNEGWLSDFCGCVVALWKRNAKATETSFRVAPELFGPGTGIAGTCLRDAISLVPCYDDPVIGKDILRHHMREYYTGREDYHGVHINSGIPFRAMALATLEHGGFAWETILPTIRDVAVNKRVGTRASFDEVAVAQRKAAVDIFGVGDLVVRTIEKGWRDVGITALDQTTPLPTDPPLPPDPVPDPGPEPGDGSDCSDEERARVEEAVALLLPAAQRFMQRRATRRARKETP